MTQFISLAIGRITSVMILCYMIRGWFLLDSEKIQLTCTRKSYREVYRLYGNEAPKVVAKYGDDTLRH